MVFDGFTMKAHNDNETFQLLGLHAARLVELVERNKEQHPDSERDRAEDSEKQKKDAEREQYVAKRIQEIRKFESRFTTPKMRKNF